MKTKKKTGTKLIILGIILDALFCISLFILYGPLHYFRDFWITTAMTTLNHQYLAQIFYSDETIAEVLANNVVIESNEDTDASLININNNKITHYSDIYEEQILKKDQGNDLYKVINIEGKGYKGFLVAVYDSSKIKLAMTKYLGTKGEIIVNLAKNNGALVAINASGFIDPEGAGSGGSPTGAVIQNGKIVTSASYPTGHGGGLVGFDEDNHLILTKESPKTALSKYKLRDAVEFGPFLIVNGKPSFIKGNGGWGIAPRTVIGQRKDGIILFLIIDGRQPGYSIGTDMVELTKIMANYKAINAANLDGGASTSLAVKGKLVNKTASVGAVGQRALPDAWIVTK